MQYNFLRNWAPEEHKHYPARLQQVAKLLLMAAARNGGSVSPGDKGTAALQVVLFSSCALYLLTQVRQSTIAQQICCLAVL